LKVPGLGVSFPFALNNSSPLKWARTYALGLYHQRCGVGANNLQVNDMPYTRFVHGNCHFAQAYVPKTALNWPDLESITFGNQRLAGYNFPICGGTLDLGHIDPCQPTSTALCTFESALYSFPQHLTIPTS